MTDPDLVIYDRELDDAFDVLEGLALYGRSRDEDGNPILHFWKPGRKAAKLRIRIDEDGQLELLATDR